MGLYVFLNRNIWACFHQPLENGQILSPIRVYAAAYLSVRSGRGGGKGFTQLKTIAPHVNNIIIIIIKYPSRFFFGFGRGREWRGEEETAPFVSYIPLFPFLLPSSHSLAPYSGRAVRREKIHSRNVNKRANVSTKSESFLFLSMWMAEKIGEHFAKTFLLVRTVYSMVSRTENGEFLLGARQSSSPLHDWNI